MGKGLKILGVDPGTNVLGFAILNCNRASPTVQDIGVIKLNKFQDHQTKLKEIFLQLQEVIETYLPNQMAVESPFYGKNVQSMLKLGRAQGVAMAAAMTMGTDIYEYAPKKIKQAITGNGNATKEQVAHMLHHRLKFVITEHYLDATDALATALCHYQQITSMQGTGSRSNSWKKFVKDNPDRIKI